MLVVRLNTLGSVPDLPEKGSRRITGYLVGTLERLNNAKRSEEHDRVKLNI